ncbi:MAG: hypothetical protein K6E50_09700 [Lachnospiraceae bacterium]|nr:hypothetical protein [Lachnospiraceae bacterium]
MNETKNKKRLFHKGAYLASLRELFVPGLVVFVLLMLTETGYMLWCDHAAAQTALGAAIIYMHYSFPYLTAPLTAVFMLISPLLLLWLFRHQMKQPGSDACYALPASPKSRLFSGSLAVLSFDLLCLASVSLYAELLIRLLPHTNVFPAENNYFLTVGNYLAASAFSTAVMMLALSLSGTVLSALLMYLTIFFLPRITISLWGALATLDNYSLPDGLAGSLFDDRLNTAVNLVLGYVLHDAFDAVKQLSSLIYTFIAALIYAAISLFFYQKRPAETAGQSASSPRVQGFFRTALSCGVCLIPLCLILEPILQHGHPYVSLDRSTILIAYCAAILVYFFYELITTRSVKKCLRSAPGLLHVLLFNVIFVFAVWEGHCLIGKDLPEADKVRSVYMTPDPDYYFYFHGEEDYYYSALLHYEIRDPEAIALLCEAARHSISGGQYREIVVTLRMHYTEGVLFKERRVDITESELEKLTELLGKDETFREIFTKPVPYEEIEEISATANSYGSGPKGSSEELYALYCAELERTKDAPLFKQMMAQAELFVPNAAYICISLKNGQRLRFNADHWQNRLTDNGEMNDALLEALLDLNDITALSSYREGESAKTSLVIRFIGTKPHFSAGEEWSEEEAALLSSPEWNFQTVLGEDGRESTQGVSTDSLRSILQRLLQRTRYWNGWDVTDRSLPYMEAEYRETREENGESRVIKEIRTEYRLEESILKWLDGGQ